MNEINVDRDKKNEFNNELPIFSTKYSNFLNLLIHNSKLSIYFHKNSYGKFSISNAHSYNKCILKLFVCARMQKK
jgi:hypothetical protein